MGVWKFGEVVVKEGFRVQESIGSFVLRVPAHFYNMFWLYLRLIGKMHSCNGEVE